MSTMEYGQSERSEPDPVAEDSGQGGDTGLQESMWNLGLGSGSVGGGESSYPERPGEQNCIYYMRTGFCGYGERCRYNHPRDRGEVYGGGRTGGGGDYPERDGQPLCQYYMRTGACKFGSSCKYHHPRHDAASATAVPLSIYGYPLRPGEKECSYYMKTGQCKFGMTCKFHHPLPTNVQGPTSTSTIVPAPGPTALTAPVVYPTGQSLSTPPQYGVAAGNWQMARPPMVPGSYIQGPYGPIILSPGVVPFPGWTPYPVSVSSVPAPSTQPTIEAGQPYGIPPASRLSAKAPAYTGGTGHYPITTSSSGPSSSIQKELSYPERHGQPECPHYMRTGECKYGPSCRYHHPAERTAQRESFSLTSMGLPFRPGAAPCSYFMQHGVCKFGPTCKYNHPMGSLSYSPSASSLSDMPVAPYPVGSSIATLAPPSSSSDLRAEVVVGSNYSSTTTSASSSDTVLTQQPGQSTATMASPSSTSEQGGTTHASS